MRRTTPTADAPATQLQEEEAGTRSRRQLLKLAGGAAVGGGLLLAGADPAAAADNGPLLMGNPDNSSGGDFTELNMGSGLAIASLSVGVDGISGNAAALQAQGNSVDIKLNGTGRLAMLSSGSGGAQPSAGPVLNDLVKGSDGALWSGVGSLGTGTWRRLNAVRVDNPNGAGTAFTPFRFVDTRDGTGGVSGARSVGGTTIYNVRNHASIPDDAIGIFGNLTVVSPTFAGWVNIWPSNVSEPVVSAINFTAGQTVANFFCLGLSTAGPAGRISIGPRKGGAQSGTVQVIVDITAYIQ